MKRRCRVRDYWDKHHEGMDAVLLREPPDHYGEGDPIAVLRFWHGHYWICFEDYDGEDAQEYEKDDLEGRIEKVEADEDVIDALDSFIRREIEGEE